MGNPDAVHNKLSRWVKWGATISGGVVAILTPMLLLYFDVKRQAMDIDAKQDIGYEKVVMPALKELQDISKEMSNWIEDTDKELVELYREKKDLEKRVMKLEAYVEMYSNRLGRPRVEIAEPEPAPEPPKKPKPSSAKPKVEVYDDLDKAQKALQ